MESEKKTTGSPEPTPLRAKRASLASEFIAYLMENKKWWMIPIILMVLLLALALILTATPAAPFMYTLW